MEHSSSMNADLKTGRYMGIGLDNMSAQNLFSYARHVESRIEKYKEMFDVDVTINLLQSEAYHVTIAESDQLFDASTRGYDYAESSGCELLFEQDGYLSVSVDFPTLMYAHEGIVSRNPNNTFKEYIGYVTIGRIQGSEDDIAATLEYVEDRLGLPDFKMEVVGCFMLESVADDWEKQITNYA